MLRLALVFLVIALIASLFGFGIIADYAFDTAKVVFFLFFQVNAQRCGWADRQRSSFRVIANNRARTLSRKRGTGLESL